MLPDWQTNCVYLASVFRTRYPSISCRLRELLHEYECEVRSVDGAKDIWVRDFMPIQVAEDEFVRFRYEPDYLRISHKHLITEEAICRKEIPGGTCATSYINLDGGNIVATERTAIVTEKVFEENRHVGHSELMKDLHELLQVDRCIVVPREPGDIFGHADGMVRFLDERTVLVNDYTSMNRAFGKRLLAILQNHGLTCRPMPYFIEDESIDGVPSAVGCYVNFLWVGSLVVMPVYGAAADEGALRTLEILLPGHELLPLHCMELARAGGGLHCVSWTIRDRALFQKRSN